MREIKFRAWDSISKKLYNWETIRVTPLYDFMTYEHYTLDQYTGLKDKNGKEIFENDIVHVKEYYSGDILIRSYNGVVNFEDGAFCINSIYGDEELNEATIQNYGIDVIGNSHENKNIL